MECRNRFDDSFQSEEIPKALAVMKMNEESNPTFYADSGATAHIVNDPGKVTSLQSYKGKEKFYM